MNKKIVILYGGTSSERDVSCVTAKSVAKAMDELKISYTKIDLVGDWISEIKKIQPTFAFLALHGCPGEDGTVQAVLDFMGIPYNGSGVLASAVAMDKSKTKKLASLNNVDVAKEVVYTLKAPRKFAETGMVLPVVVKPICGGSSLGVSIVKTESDWLQALKDVEEYGAFMVEEYISGIELTVGLMNDIPLAVTEITTTKNAFYNYDAKYADGGSEHITPAIIKPELYDLIMENAVKVVESIGCTGVSRVDYIYNEEHNRLVLLEVNTLPGLTPTSLVPEQAKYKNIDFNQLILWMMEN